MRVCVCVCVCVRACVRACVCVCVGARARAVNSMAVYWDTNCNEIVNYGYSKQVNGNKLMVHI